MAFRIRDLMINVGPQGGLGRRVVCGDSQAVCLDWTADLGQGCVDITIDPNCWLPSGQTYTCGFTCNTTGPTCGVTCPNYTCPPVTYRCGNLASAVAITPVYYHPPNLAALKEQLRTALAEVEAQEKAAEEASRPRTREEAENLEEKLKGALEEVRGWKETLPSRGSK